MRQTTVEAHAGGQVDRLDLDPDLHIDICLKHILH